MFSKTARLAALSTALGAVTLSMAGDASAQTVKTYLDPSGSRVFNTPGPTHPFFCIDGEVCQTGDFDGNGTADLIAFTRGNRGDVYVSLSTPDGFVGNGWKWHDWFCAFEETCRVGDVNGDKKDDIIAFTHGIAGAVFVAYSTGNGFVGSGWRWGDGIATGNAIPHMADVNGDGTDDVVVINAYSGDVTVALADPALPGGPRFLPTPVPWATGACLWHLCAFGNFDANRGADLVQIGTYGSMDTAITVWSSNTWGFFTPTTNWNRTPAVLPGIDGARLQVIDMDKNGFDDISLMWQWLQYDRQQQSPTNQVGGYAYVQRAQFFLSDGWGFTGQHTNRNPCGADDYPDQCWLGHFDSDSFADQVVISYRF